MSFQQGLSGLDAESRNLEVIGNNIANVDTAGFKQARAEFADVYASSLTGAGASQVGIGTKISKVTQQFTQGNISSSTNSLDMAISGGGFFRMSNNGVVTYSRNGQFQFDKFGYIVNAAGSRLTGYGVGANNILSTGAPAELKLDTADLPPKITANSTALLNLDSREPVKSSAAFSLADPTTYNHSTSVSVYDSLGNSHIMQMYFVKTAPGAWNMFATNDGTQIGAGSLGTINFTSSGTLTGTSTINLSIPLTNGATTPQAIAVNFNGTTQFGSGFSVNSLSQDGSASGRLSGFSVSSDGMVVGRYTNGQSSTLGQVVLANFINPAGLESLGNNAWSETSTSGTPLVSTPGTGSLGILQSSAVENSNVDLTKSLVELITSQRAYQANAQTIKTQDQVLQTLVNIR